MKNILIVSGHTDLNDSVANKKILDMLAEKLPQSRQVHLDSLYPDFAIDAAAEIIREKSGEVADNMKQINSNTQENCRALEHVTAASQENSAGAESLAEIVEQIKELSEQLHSSMTK